MVLMRNKKKISSNTPSYLELSGVYLKVAMTMRSHLTSSQFNSPILVGADQWYYINKALLMGEIV